MRLILSGQEGDIEPVGGMHDGKECKIIQIKEL
jgi:hypothetical protein